ncbi:hypothetical protein TCAL_11108 [Tigriopus californicus]|uniref:Short-chain dehydrogenase/reductase 3 n=1 Tax=Tigriopus californicus TaxID=6832 RepID=A0A553PDJ7_TIGCA|nr:estradiol 17-beta-dehydrogenase 11-like [Tigriopus californicus]TRY75747.1 hypothetical protein TCAL_11108 [Tigriopus californicus]|eukprot:TCALIF_11108-PA protein Name:"Similar to Hsd17b11 Estradiol 17-beta-dehydrogenase 11 (Mus musculus)" AED:0.10 eAED:0.10 QI:483/1/1/1/0.66/0.5/4/40/306
MEVGKLLLDILMGLALSLYYGVINLAKSFFPDQFKKDVANDVVLITGAGSGLGRLMAYQFAKLGAIVVSVDVNKKSNDETVKKINETGGKAFGYVCDLSDRAKIYETANKVRAEVGTVSILVNNAGIVSGTFLLDTRDESIDRTFKVNILAHFWTIKAFLPDMISQKKGQIVNIASLAGHGGQSKLVDYCSSKFAAVGLDEAMRVELKYLGHDNYIKTTCVCPYYINTGMFDGVDSKFIPILNPDYVVKIAMDGILTNTQCVFVPWWIKILMAFRVILPPEGFQLLSTAFGLNSCMDEFKGRKKIN